MFNCRHPGPRRVWIGGSQRQLKGTCPLAPLDPRDPVNPVACSKIVDFTLSVVKIGPWALAQGPGLGPRPWARAQGQGPGPGPWAKALGQGPGPKPWARALGPGLFP